MLYYHGNAYVIKRWITQVSLWNKADTEWISHGYSPKVKEQSQRTVTNVSTWITESPMLSCCLRRRRWASESSRASSPSWWKLNSQRFIHQFEFQELKSVFVQEVTQQVITVYAFNEKTVRSTVPSLAPMRGCPLRVFLVMREFLFFLAIAASFRRSSSSRNLAAFSA